MKKYHIGYTCGVYDLFHVGHLNLFERCKEMCDILIVGVCNDEYVRKIKNKEPVINENDRLRIVKYIKSVDEAYFNDKNLALEKFKFDVLFSGDDWKGTERYEKTEEEFKKRDVSIEYLPYTKNVSTTMIKEKLKNTK